MAIARPSGRGKASGEGRAAWNSFHVRGYKIPVNRLAAAVSRTSADRQDALVIFEVLSRSNTRVDQAWRRKVYASVPNCRHYVTVSAHSVAVVRYDRDSRWAKSADLTTLDDSLELPALNAALSLAQLYQWTPLGQR